MDDILGIGKIIPIDKLIELVSKSVGKLSKQYFDKKDIDTKAYDIKRLAEARVEEMKIIAAAVKETYQLTGGIAYTGGKLSILSPNEKNSPSVLINPSLEDRAEQRLNFKEAKKQLNIESVTSFAANALKNEKSVTDEPINEDWSTRFFNIAEDVSNEEMQALWGRILAGEIKQPKSFSLKTLEILKNISKQDAELFTKFANLKLGYENQAMIFNPEGGEFLRREFGITFINILELSELGLITSENNFAFSFNPTNKFKITSVIFYGSKGIAFHRGEDTPKQDMQVIMFTKAGKELSSLIQQPINVNYIEKICANFKHPNVKIEFGDVIQLPNNQIGITNRIEYDK